MPQSTIMSVLSHVEMAPPLPGHYQYFRGVKCLAKGQGRYKVMATTTIACLLPQ